jgi:hypothetical protein
VAQATLWFLRLLSVTDRFAFGVVVDGAGKTLKAAIRKVVDA